MGMRPARGRRKSRAPSWCWSKAASTDICGRCRRKAIRRSSIFSGAIELKMKKQEILDKHQKYLFSSVANYYDDPLVVDHAKGTFIYDIEGKEYLDFFGGILTISVGHCNEKVTAAIDAQTHKLQHASTLHPN